MQLDTKGTASLFVSLTQYKQITHGPMELAKHRGQCIQRHVSAEEHIHQIIYGGKLHQNNCQRMPADLRAPAAVTTRPAPARTRKSLKEKHRPDSHDPQRPALMNNCCGNQRSKNVSCPRAEKRSSFDRELRLIRCWLHISHQQQGTKQMFLFFFSV